jgi:hypothetical protein
LLKFPEEYQVDSSSASNSDDEEEDEGATYFNLPPSLKELRAELLLLHSWNIQTLFLHQES